MALTCKLEGRAECTQGKTQGRAAGLLGSGRHLLLPHCCAGFWLACGQIWPSGVAAAAGAPMAPPPVNSLAASAGRRERKMGRQLALTCSEQGSLACPLPAWAADGPSPSSFPSRIVIPAIHAPAIERLAAKRALLERPAGWGAGGAAHRAALGAGAAVPAGACISGLTAGCRCRLSRQGASSCSLQQFSHLPPA